MKYLVFLLMAFCSISISAQNQKYVEVFNIFLSSSNFNSSGAKIGSVPTSNGLLQDAQQKDLAQQRDSNLQPYGTIGFEVKNISDKKIKSVSFLVNLSRENKIIYKRNVSEKVNLNPDETRKIKINITSVSNFVFAEGSTNNYAAMSKIGKEVIIKKIVFEDGTKLNF